MFCFFTPPSNRYGDGVQWTLELIFISQCQDCFSGQVTLVGDTKRDDQPLGEWLNRVLDTAKGRWIETFYKPMYAAVSYVVKVFLYMALRQARSVEHREYDEAMRRIAGLGVKKRARLLQRVEFLYNGIRSVRMSCSRRALRMSGAVPWRRIGAVGISECRLAGPGNESAS